MSVATPPASSIRQLRERVFDVISSYLTQRADGDPKNPARFKIPAGDRPAFHRWLKQRVDPQKSVPITRETLEGVLNEYRRSRRS